MITAFRLEKDGFGPARHPEHGFWNPYSKLRKHYHDLDMYRHLELVEDDYWFIRDLPPLDNSRTDYRFACPSLEMLMAYWTPEFFQACLDEGFEVKAYQVEGKIWMCPAGIQFFYMLDSVADNKAA